MLAAGLLGASAAHAQSGGDGQFGLNQAVSRALTSNIDLLVEREDYQISREQVTRELGDLGWKLETNLAYQNSSDPLNSREYVAVGGLQLPGTNQNIYHSRSETFDTVLKRKLWPGTEIQLHASGSRLINDTNQQKDALIKGPELSGFAGITIIQPLLQGFGKSKLFAPIEIARLKQDAQRLMTEVKAMNLVAEVASRYIDVLASDRAMVVRQENVKRADELVERNRRRASAGVGVEIDITTAQLARSQRENELIGTTSDRVEKLNALLALLDEPPTFADAHALAPLDAAFDAQETYDQAQLVRQAEYNRLDLAYYRRLISAAQVNVRRVRDLTRPKLDFQGTYGVSALDKEIDNVLEDMGNPDGEQWSLGISLKMDLDHDSVQSARRIAQRQLFQASMQYEKARRSVALEIDTALKRVASARQQLETALQAQDLAQKRLDQEMRSLDSGKGDLYKVVEQQQVFGDAQADVETTRAQLRKSLVALWIASGQIFERLGVTEVQMYQILKHAPSDLRGGRIQ